jgi:hypothetical protein
MERAGDPGTDYNDAEAQGGGLEGSQDSLGKTLQRRRGRIADPG